MHDHLSPFVFLLIASLSSAAELQEVASFASQQITGVGVSVKSGRIFVNFPYWSDDHFLSVAEIVNGQPKPFPNEEWNKLGPAGSHFICVQSVIVDDHDNLWILDPASAKMQEIVKGGPKLVKVDLATNQVVQTIPFGEDITPAKGAIIVVNLTTGKARRLLDGHKSTQPEKDVKLTVDGTKGPPQIASDGIALDEERLPLLPCAHRSHALSDQNRLSHR